MATRESLHPFSAEFPLTNFPQLLVVNTRPVLAFDASTAEKAFWGFAAPQGLTGTLYAVIYYMMASATTGGLAFDIAVEAVTDGDTLDLDTTSSPGTVNTVTTTAVPTTAGYLGRLVCTLTNDDSLIAGDYMRLSVERAVSNGSDTATGDCYILAVEFRDSA